MKFNEYVIRRDEASFNPYDYKNLGSEMGQAAKTITGLPVGAGAAMVGAAAGMGAMAPEYRRRVTGNPYIDPNGVRTEGMAKGVFQKTSDWILDFIAGQKMPKVKQFYISSLSSHLDQILKYVQTHEKPEKPIAGVTMGSGAGTMSNIFALPMALVGGVRQALKNAWDSFNPQYAIDQEWSVNVQKMVYALDAMYMMLPNGDDMVEAYVQELLHNLGSNAQSRRIGRQ